jgi:hypothetical protein
MQQGTSRDYWDRVSTAFSPLVSHRGVIITLKSEADLDALNRENFSLLEAGNDIVFGLRRASEQQLAGVASNGCPIPLPAGCKSIVIVVSSQQQRHHREDSKLT